MKKIITLLFCSFLLFGFVNSVQAQQDLKDGLYLKSKPVLKARGSDTNNPLKGAPQRDENLPVAPKIKGGSDPGDCGCEITFDNYTAYCVDIFVDGIYQGTTGSWQKSIVNVNSGKIKVYLTNSSKTKEWSVEGQCKGKYTWKVGD